MEGLEPPARLVSRALAQRSPGDRPEFLRQLMAHAAAGLTVLQGDRVASEITYRLADAVIARGQDGGQPQSRRAP